MSAPWLPVIRAQLSCLDQLERYLQGIDLLSDRLSVTKNAPKTHEKLVSGAWYLRLDTMLQCVCYKREGKKNTYRPNVCFCFTQALGLDTYKTIVREHSSICKPNVCYWKQAEMQPLMVDLFKIAFMLQL